MHTKKFLLFSMVFITTFALNAQTVITGWTFPVNSGPDSLNANMGLTGNLGYDIRFEGTDTTYDVIYFADGATDYAAAAKGWDNGADTKFWSIKFKAADYTNFKVSSKQYSTIAGNGPKDFKLQWKLSGGTYEDVPSGSLIVMDDWTTGVVTELPVPITGQGTSSVYIRWIMASNDGVLGGSVAAGGETRIDDILVTATSTLGQEEILYTDRISVSPNPNKGCFTVHSTVPMSSVRISDLSGKTLHSAVNCGTSAAIDLLNPAPGTYFLSVKFSDRDSWYTKKIVVE